MTWSWPHELSKVLKRALDGPALDEAALKRELARRIPARPELPVIPMEQHLASLPPSPPMFEPEWMGDEGRGR